MTDDTTSVAPVMVTQAQLARMWGVARSTVHMWIKRGRIVADASGLIDPVFAARMRDSTESKAPMHQARRAQIEAKKVAAGVRGDFPHAADDHEWEVRRQSRECAASKRRDQAAVMRENRLLRITRENEARLFVRAARREKIEAASLRREQAAAARAALIAAEVSRRNLEGKRCSKCGNIKPLTAFSQYRKSSDGHQASCKSCTALASSKYRSDNREHFRALQARSIKAKIDGLDDSYIRNLMTKRSEILKPVDIPQSLVDVKRLQLQITRHISKTGGLNEERQ